MDSDQQSFMPVTPHRERASNITSSILEEVSRGGDNQLITYHRRVSDGEYMAVHLSPIFRFSPKEKELIVDCLDKKINEEYAPYISIIPTVNVYLHSPNELAGTYAVFLQSIDVHFLYICTSVYNGI
ncbi:NAC domain-containing protein 2-like [Dorcoceras hygrometricum]|uniref:NAC domain-containing protein 2-like n=1 Tax=Dorcoceras hygrometricum TaxID=472368 RepID=A0A2Z7BYE5_9LAMI|nr:NAC domain-containing protein 2-like [Dorcoceras hygrometricum]